METIVNPLSIIFVKSDSKGDRLLFRYPYHIDIDPTTQKQENHYNPYALQVVDDILQNPLPQTSNISHGQLTGFTDEVLSTLFAVKPELCNKKFELKVNDVRFVSHPTLMQSHKPNETVLTSILINIVFALHAQASYSIVKCYYELSRKLGTALLFEEANNSYLTNEIKLMSETHDEAGSFDQILEMTTLAQCLKSIYHDLCTTGLLNVTINQSVTLCFCLPQKAHQFHKKGVIVEPEAIDRCLNSLKPYHGMLLLVDCGDLLDCVPPHGARLLLQLIGAYNPLKSLQNMAIDANLAIEHVYELVGHLVYWAKATIIYPLCETNVYVIASDAPLYTSSPLVEKFSAKFPGMSLFEVISDFSLPTSIGHLTTPLHHPTRQGILAQMVLWMLQHHLLMQLHTYVQFMPTDLGECEEVTPELEEIVENTSPMTPEGELNTESLISLSSQPMAVPNTSRRSITDLSESQMATSHISVSSESSKSIQSNFSSPPNSISSGPDMESSVAFGMEDSEKIKKLLMTFPEPDRSAITRIPASSNAEDLAFLVKLWQRGYFKGEHHLEEIMYFENLRRSQLLQLLDKFRDVLILYETEDPAIASMYSTN